MKESSEQNKVARLEAGMILSRNPTAKVLCPVCAKANLEVVDVPFGINQEYFERYLICPSCGSRSILRMHK